MHDLLNILSHQRLFLVNIKHKYWTVNIYLDNRHYLVFYVSKIGQVQLNRMLQEAKTSF